MDNRLILVAGSGRSGTSLLAGVLKAMGAHVPQPEVIPDESNPQGFGEPRWVVELHTKLLSAADVRLSDARTAAWAKTAEVGRDRDVQADLENWLRREFRQNDHVLVKDPRLLWFVPLWQRAGEAVAAPCFVTTLRHPLEVITSKQMYYGGRWHPNNRIAGWLNIMLFTERATRGARRTLVRYDDLLSDCMQVLANLNENLDLALIERSTPSQARDAARLVDPSLRRARGTWDSLGVDDRLVELAEETIGVLNRAATSDSLENPSIRSELDRLRESYVNLFAFAESVVVKPSVPARGSPARGGNKAKAGAPTTRVKAARRVWRRAKRKARSTLYARRRSRTDQPASETASEEMTTAPVPKA
jgi:hypothetical protein